MFTPQRLFAGAEPSADLLSHAQFLERARVERELKRDATSRVALAAYLVARLVDRQLIVSDSSDERQGLLWQLQSTRRFIDELPNDDPETAHLAGIVDAVSHDDARRLSVLRVTLTAYAYFLEHEGRLEEALEVLGLSAHTHGRSIEPVEFVSYALFAARINRVLARWDRANAGYQAAEEAASTVGDMTGVLRGRLGRGAVLRGQGNLPAARRVSEDIVREARRHGLPEVEAMAYADLAAVLDRQGFKFEAIEAEYQAFLLTPDLSRRMRTLANLGSELVQIGAYAVARRAFEIVHASPEAAFLVRANAVIELMGVESATQNRVGFERWRQEARGFADRLAPSTAVDYRVKMGIGLARFGNIARAEEILREALALAEANRLNEWYFRIESVLAELSSCAAVEPAMAEPAGADGTPAFAEMAAGLEEYAASMA